MVLVQFKYLSCLTCANGATPFVYGVLWRRNFFALFFDKAQPTSRSGISLCIIITSYAQQQQQQQQDPVHS